MNTQFIRYDLPSSHAHYIEEAGEVLAAIGKTLRFGPLSVNPLVTSDEQESNQAWLRRELDDLRRAMDRLDTALANRSTTLAQDRELVRGFDAHGLVRPLRVKISDSTVKATPYCSSCGGDCRQDGWHYK